MGIFDTAAKAAAGMRKPANRIPPAVLSARPGAAMTAGKVGAQQMKAPGGVMQQPQAQPAAPALPQPPQPPGSAPPAPVAGQVQPPAPNQPMAFSMAPTGAPAVHHQPAQSGATTQTAGGYQPDPNAFQGERMGGALEDFAGQGLQQPTRFDNNLVQQGLGAIRRETDSMAGDRMRQLSEMMARRGMLGSSVEADQGRRMLTDLQDVSSKRALDLGLEQARTYAGDRSAAGSMALGVGDFQRGLGQDREGANRYGWEAGRTTGRDAEDDRRARADEDYRGRSFDNDSRMRELQLLLQAYGTIGA